MNTLDLIRSGFSPYALLIFSATFATLYAAHQVGDHWVQTHRQACSKGERTSVGAFACFTHVVSLTMTKLAALGLLWFVTRFPLGLALVPALLIDAVSHYWADRRWTLQQLAERLGKGDFYRLGAGHLGSGAYALDQSWHIGWLFITSLIIAAGA